MEHYCKNHPDRKARKKCHHCSKYICSECELNYLGQTFCSIKCLIKAILKSILALFKINPKTVAARRASIIHRIHIKPVKVFLYMVFAAIVIILWLSLRNLSEEIRLLRIEQQNNMILNGISPAPQTGLTGFNIKKRPDAMVVSNTIDITGEAADSIILSLKVNGRLTAVTIPKQNKFIFKDIKLNYGSNEIIVHGLDTDGNTAILQKIVTYYGRPRLDFLAKDITRGNINEKKIALTFDGGAGNGAASEILDYLAEKKIKCTMFLTGSFLKRYPDIAKRMVKEGHEIGNHTWSHPHLTTFFKNRKQNTAPGITEKKLHSELNKTAKLFEKITKTNMSPFWRAPYGEHNLQIRRWASGLGYRQIGWTLGNGENLDTHDWVIDSTSTIYKTPQQVMNKILNFGNGSSKKTNGGIILMHLDTQRKDNQIHHMIPALIDSLHYRGYQLVKVSELLQ